MQQPVEHHQKTTVKNPQTVQAQICSWRSQRQACARSHNSDRTRRRNCCIFLKVHAIAVQRGAERGRILHLSSSVLLLLFQKVVWNQLTKVIGSDYSVRCAGMTGLESRQRYWLHPWHSAAALRLLACVCVLKPVKLVCDARAPDAYPCTLWR